MGKIISEASLDLDHLVARAEKIGENVCVKERTVSDTSASWVKDSMQALKQEGLTALVVPQDCGGMGKGLFALARICETLGKAYSSVGLCFGMHCVGTAVIAAKATSFQKQKYLELIAQGEHITTLALSEAGTGAHFYIPQTSLLPISETSFLVNGNKTFVTNGSHADSYVISTMAAAHDANPDQFSCVVLDAATQGIQWGPEWDGLGMRGNSSRPMKLTNVTISDHQILGEQGDQLWYVFNVVAPYFLTAMSSTYLGIASCALQEAKEYLNRRVYAHNGSSLSHVSLLQHRLGVLWARVERTRTLIYSAANKGDSGDPGAVLSLLSAKAEAAACCVDTVNDVMTLSGGIGYSNNGLLSMLLRDARAAHVMAPTTDMLYTWVGRALLDQPILSD